MIIDLSSLKCGNEKIDISGIYHIEKEYYDKTEIISLSDIKVTGKIELKEEEENELANHLNCTIEGVMIINDSISLEEVEYPFIIEYNDFLQQKDENRLDILQFLWENIVLEIPLQFTKVRDLSKYHGDGWRLVSEEEYQNRENPFYDLLKDFEKE